MKRALAVAEQTARACAERRKRAEVEAAHLYTSLVVIRDDLEKKHSNLFAYVIARNALRAADLRVGLLSNEHDPKPVND